MFGSRFGQQARNIRRYIQNGTVEGVLQDVVVSVMFWIHVPVPPQVGGYFIGFGCAHHQLWVPDLFENGEVGGEGWGHS